MIRNDLRSTPLDMDTDARWQTPVHQVPVIPTVDPHGYSRGFKILVAVAFSLMLWALIIAVGLAATAKGWW